MKAELKHLKQLAKREPRIFARMASLEMENGKLKKAAQRLRKGLKKHPEYITAHALLADCMSQLGKHEDALKIWEKVIKAEPMNQMARTGYVRELAFIDNRAAMDKSLAKLYEIDPTNQDVNTRYQETLLRAVRKRHPNKRVWEPHWHPLDFTKLGASMRAIAYELNLSPTRNPLPSGFEPKLDEALIQKIKERLDIQTPEPDVEASFTSLIEDRAEPEPKTKIDEPEIEIEIEDATETDIEPKEIEFEETSEPEVSADMSVALAEDLEAEEAPEAPLDVEDEVPEDEQKEDEVPVEELKKKNKLYAALLDVDVDPTGVTDIEEVINQLEEADFRIVKEPVIADLPKKASEIPITQSDLDKLASATAKQPEVETALTQSDLNQIVEQPETENISASSTVERTSQEDLDKLVSSVKDETPEPPKEEEKSSGGQMSQAELDALFAAQKPAAPAKPEPPKEEEKSSGGQMSQAELDALFAAQKPAAPAKPEPPKEEEKSSGGQMSQAELDALFAAQKPAAPAKPAPPIATEEVEKVAKTTPDTAYPITQSEIAAITDHPEALDENESFDITSMTQSDLDTLLHVSEESTQKETSSTFKQSDLDAFIAQKKAEEEKTRSDNSSTLSQDDLDQIVQNRQKTAEKETHSHQEDLDDLIRTHNQNNVTPPALTMPEDQEEETEEEKKYKEVTQDDLDLIIAQHAAIDSEKEDAKSEEEKEREAKRKQIQESMKKRLDSSLIDQDEIEKVVKETKDGAHNDEDAEYKRYGMTDDDGPTKTLTLDELQAKLDSSKAKSSAAKVKAKNKPAPVKEKSTSSDEEPETPPEALHGPVTKTFAKLCLLQGKTQHAAEIARRLKEKHGDDPEIDSLLEEIKQRMAEA